MITSLTMKNFRGFLNEKITISSNITVFVGENGVGKSTILEALRILLSSFPARLLTENQRKIDFEKEQIHNGQSFTQITVETTFDDKKYQWMEEYQRIGLSKSDFSGLDNLVQHFQEKLSHNGDQQSYSLPIIVSYAVERTISQHAIQPKTSKEHNLFEIYDSSFDSALSFEHFFQWFKDKSDLELQVREEETDKVIKLEKNLALQGMSYADWMNLLKKAREYEIPELQLVRQAIEYFFADFRNLRVNRNSPLRLELQKGDEILLVNQLSDGEKSVLTMIGDIARRLHLANPNMKDPLQGEGVVMIDEIELHLHPKWQQDILPKFRALFPNIQFIITTHSPHVISNVGENDLYQLVRRNGVLEVIPCVDNYGKKPQAILEDIQGLERLRPENIEKKFQQIYVQLDENDLESAKYSVQALQEQIGNDEELVKLRLLIRKKEILSP